MAIRIKNILVKDLGPIKKLDFKPAVFNLIFSPNEKGKTFLTEFIIRSLFKNISRWSYIRKSGTGKIYIGGLGNDNKTIEFSPSSKRKLEDFWEEEQKGLPPSIAKLLVVRGGEAGIEENNGGVNRYYIREVLSGLNILDRIDNSTNISSTIKKARIENDNITISDMGEGKKYYDAKKNLAKLKEIFERVENQYAQGIIKTYKKEKNLIEEKLNILERAKKHLAWVTDKKIKELKEILFKLPEERIIEIEKKISLYYAQEDSFKRDKEAFNRVCKNCRDYKWLEKAYQVYKGMLFNLKDDENKFRGVLPLKAVYILILLAVAGIAAVLAGFFLPLIHLIITGVIFIAASIAYSIYSIRKASIIDISKILQNEELEKIRQEFKQRFGISLSDIALLEDTLKEQEKNYNLSESIGIRLQENGDKLNEAFTGIVKQSENLSGKSISSVEEAVKILNNLKENNSKIRIKISENERILYGLAVDPSDYISEPVTDPGGIEIKFSLEQYGKTVSQFEDLNREISAQERELEMLKHDICSLTDDDYSIEWDELINSLRNRIFSAQGELADIKSSIAAGIIVHNVVEDLRQEEDVKIENALESEKVITPLREITKRYSGLHLEEDRLIVSDEYDDFDLKELSTGSREQVMLALRIGFCRSLLGDEPLFLILDDAFQHSDWEKRQILVAKLAEITIAGWQVIYFTMDNHIKDLFNHIAEKHKEIDYKILDLQEL